MTPVLRPYQVDVLQRGRRQIAHGKKHGIIQGQTGSGKSFVIAEMVRCCVDKGKRCLILAHRRKLVRQLSKTLEVFGVSYGVIMRDETRSTTCSCIVASRDTLNAWARRDLSLPQSFDLIVVDECHLSMGDTYQQLFKLWNNAIVVGFTATPARGDGKRLDDFFQWMECTVPSSQLIREGYLVKPETYVPLELAQLRKKGKKPKKLAGDPVEHWKLHAVGLPTIAFSRSVAESIKLREQFREAGIIAEHIDADSSDAIREDCFERLRTGKISVLCSVKLLIEGVDIPEVSCAILWSRFGSVVEFSQACLDSETEVLSKRGWVRYNTIEKTDEVATFDEENNEISWCFPKNVFHRPIKDGEKMYEVRSPHLDIRVTGDHSMIYRRQGKTAVNWRRTTAEELATMESNSMSVIPIAGYESVSGLSITDDEIRFIGWFLTDGYHHKEKDFIAISQSSKSPYLDDIRKCLHGCGFKFSEYIHKRYGKWEAYAPGIVFQIMNGRRGSKTSHRPWERLRAHLDKDFSVSLELLNARQLTVLLEAMFCGDGNKQRTAYWTPKTLSIGTGNKTMADRLQSLCVRRGIRCNISTEDRSGRSLGNNDYYTLRYRPHTQALIGCPRSEEGRSRFVLSPSSPGEIVWCMTTTKGSLVTRRNGKVAIVGNCGRIMRPAPGKTRAVVLDHGGASAEHGLPGDDILWSLDNCSTVKERRKQALKNGGLQKVIVCRECGMAFSGEPTCPGCGCRAIVLKSAGGVATDIEEARDQMLSRYDQTPEERAQRQESMQRAWLRYVAIACNSGRKAGAAAGMFSRQFGIPPWEAGVSPLASGPEWKMQASEVFRRAKV